jgi:hypothetical protein
MLLAIAAGSVSVQEAFAQQKLAVGLDTMPLFKGLIWSDSDADNSLFAISPSFEYLVAPHFSIGGIVDIWPGTGNDVDVFYFGFAAQGRWYPLSNGLDKLFVGAALGFNMLSVDGEDPDTEHGGFAGPTVSLRVGWKLLFGSHFFVEPSMGYVYSKVSEFGGPTPLGWQPGLIIGGTF